MRNPARGRLAAVFAILAALTVCTGDAHPAGYAADVFFPTYPRSPQGAYPSALLADVTLVQESGCLFAESLDGARSLLLWPEGYAPVRRNGHIAVVDEDGQVVGEEGRPDSFGGGAYGLGDARYHTGKDIPLRCRLTGDSYWLVSPESA